MEKEEHTDDDIDETVIDETVIDETVIDETVIVDSKEDTESVGYDKDEIDDDIEIDSVILQNPEKNEDYINTNYYNIIHIVSDDERITSNIMSKFEWSEIIGIRTCHIESGGVVYTETGVLTDPRMIAIKELQDRKCPLLIIRKIGDNKVEHWRCNEMGFPVDVDNVF